MSASGPNIQLELRLAEMARMNEEIRRRHLEVEADKRRAQRTGGMVTRDQSITMATAMPTDFDASREDGFKDGLDSRPLPADPYGKDRVPRDKRGKPQDKINKNSKNKKQTIDEARQRGMADQEYWRQEQARADAARIKRAQGRDGTWRREWDREKNHSDERDSFSRRGGGGDKSRDKFRRGDSGRGDGQMRRHDRDSAPMGGRYGGRGGGGQSRDHGPRHDRDLMRRDGPPKGFRNDRDRHERNRRGSGDDYHRFQQPIKRYEKRNKKPTQITPDRPERESSSSEPDLGSVEVKSEDSLREYSSDENRRRQKDDDESGDDQIELPPSIESSRDSESQSEYEDEKDEIDTEILEALQAQQLADEVPPGEATEKAIPEDKSEEKTEANSVEKEEESASHNELEAESETQARHSEENIEEKNEESTSEGKIENESSVTNESTGANESTPVTSPPMTSPSQTETDEPVTSQTVELPQGVEEAKSD